AVAAARTCGAMPGSSVASLESRSTPSGLCSVVRTGWWRRVARGAGMGVGVGVGGGEGGGAAGEAVLVQEEGDVLGGDGVVAGVGLAPAGVELDGDVAGGCGGGGGGGKAGGSGY